VELRQLRYFVEVASAGTYAAASERLHVAQPGVWKQVQSLEHELGVALFERIGRRVRLTGDGALVLARAQSVLAGAAGVHQLADDLRAGVTGSVVVGCVPSHIVGFLGRVLTAHRRDHPGVRVTAAEIDAASATDGADPFAGALSAGTVDVITTASPAEGFPGFPIYDVNVVAAVAPRHRWQGRTHVHIRELTGETTLAMPLGYLSRTLVDDAAIRAGVELRVAMASSSPVALLALGRDGMGVPVIASDAIPPQTRQLPIIVDDNGPLSRTVSLHSRSVEHTSVAVRDFVEHARRLVSAHNT